MRFCSFICKELLFSTFSGSLEALCLLDVRLFFLALGFVKSVVLIGYTSVLSGLGTALRTSLRPHSPPDPWCHHIGRTAVRVMAHSTRSTVYGPGCSLTCHIVVQEVTWFSTAAMDREIHVGAVVCRD
jgi:hypothetical protein